MFNKKTLALPCIDFTIGYRTDAFLLSQLLVIVYRKRATGKSSEELINLFRYLKLARISLIFRLSSFMLCLNFKTEKFISMGLIHAQPKPGTLCQQPFVTRP
jgi:hypothetical protein